MQPKEQKEGPEEEEEHLQCSTHSALFEKSTQGVNNNQKTMQPQEPQQWTDSKLSLEVHQSTGCSNGICRLILEYAAVCPYAWYKGQEAERQMRWEEAFACYQQCLEDESFASPDIKGLVCVRLAYFYMHGYRVVKINWNAAEELLNRAETQYNERVRSNLWRGFLELERTSWAMCQATLMSVAVKWRVLLDQKNASCLELHERALWESYIVLGEILTSQYVSPAGTHTSHAVLSRFSMRSGGFGQLLKIQELLQHYVRFDSDENLLQPETNAHGEIDMVFVYARAVREVASPIGAADSPAMKFCASQGHVPARAMDVLWGQQHWCANWDERVQLRTDLAEETNYPTAIALLTELRNECDHYYVQYLLKASKQGLVHARYILACLLSDGTRPTAMPVNTDRARQEIEYCASKGHSAACWRLARILFEIPDKERSEEDANRCFQLCLQAYNNNERGSARFVGDCYARGIGVPQNPDKAQEYFRLSGE